MTEDPRSTGRNALPYYPRYPRDLFEGTAGMPFEDKAAYGLVIDLIYLQRGRLPDDPRYIAGQLGLSVRKWNAIRQRLIDAGKLRVDRGFISNKRADDVLKTQSKYQDRQAENRAGSSKNSNLQKPASDLPEPESEPESGGREERARDAPTEDFVVDLARRVSRALRGRATGGSEDQIELQTWLALGLTPHEIEQKAREVGERQQHDPVRSFRFLGEPMRRLAGRKSAPPPTPIPPTPGDDNDQGPNHSRPAGNGGGRSSPHDEFAAGFLRAGRARKERAG